MRRFDVAERRARLSRRHHPDGVVALQILEDVGADAQAALGRRAAELTTWLDGVVVAPRFPSPLWRSTGRPR